jgi:hypothetical protein
MWPPACHCSTAHVWGGVARSGHYAEIAGGIHREGYEQALALDREIGLRLDPSDTPLVRRCNLKRAASSNRQMTGTYRRHAGRIIVPLQ